VAVYHRHAIALEEASDIQRPARGETAVDREVDVLENRWWLIEIESLFAHVDFGNLVATVSKLR